MDRPATFDHLVGKKKPLTKTVTVVLDPDLIEEYEETRRLRDDAAARSDRNGKDAEAAFQLLETDQKLADLRRRLEDDQAVAYFRFRGIGRHAYEALVDKHPPTPEQRTKAKAGGFEAVAWNYDTFPPALVAACLVEPAVTVDDVQAMWDSADWNQAELQTLLNAAIEVNGTRRTVELGKG